MGICIAYQGKLRDRALVAELMRDLDARSRAVGWPRKTVTELVAAGAIDCAGLDGITLYPHRDCDPLHFHFDREGTLVNHVYYSLVHDPEKAASFLQAMAESTALAQQVARSTDRQTGRERTGESGVGLEVRIVVPGAQHGSAEGAGAGSLFEQGMRYNWTKTQFAGAKIHVAVCAVLRHVQQRYAPALEIVDDSGYFVDGDYQKLEAELAQVDYFLSTTRQAARAAAASGPMTLDDFIERLGAELADAPNKLH